MAVSFRSSWDRVHDAVEYVVEWGLQRRTLESIFAIGVDEIQYAKGHKYLTLVYQIDRECIRLLWVGKERTIESFQGFFRVIGEKVAAEILFVCSDMWKPYLDVIGEKCINALHILDRFHIMAKMSKALDEVRAQETKRLIRDGYQPLLKKSRWCVLKRKENLTDKQQVRLRDLLRYNLQTVRAYLLKEDFQQFWTYSSPVWAGKFLDFWCHQVMRSRIEPMKKFARTLREHRELLLNYFRARKEFSSGVVEGLNNKAKVVMRRSYGFRTFRVLELALYHSLAKLPEPILAPNSSDESKINVDMAVTFLKKRPGFAASQHQAMSRGRELIESLSEQEKKNLTPPRLGIALRLHDIRAEAYLPLVNDVASQEAYITVDLCTAVERTHPA